MDLQATAASNVELMLKRDAFSRWLGVELVSVAPGEAVVRMVVREEMINGFGVCHGGITFAVADSAFAFAANTAGRISLSIANNISYALPVRSGDILTAAARESSPGDKIAVYDVTVSNQHGSRVALFRGTVYRTQRKLAEQPAGAESTGER